MGAVSLSLDAYRRRRTVPEGLAQALALSFRDLFFTRGETGKALYAILKVIEANRRAKIRRGTLAVALNVLQGWFGDDFERSRESGLDEALCDHIIRWCGCFGAGSSSEAQTFSLRIKALAQEAIEKLRKPKAAEETGPRSKNADLGLFAFLD